MATDRVRTGWFPDLSNRYRSRYWNGRDWTAWVLDEDGHVRVDDRLQGRFAVRRAQIWADVVFEHHNRIWHLQVTGDEVTWQDRTIGFGSVRAAAAYEQGSGRARSLNVHLEASDGPLVLSIPVGDLEPMMAKKCDTAFSSLNASFHSNLFPRLVGEVAHRLNADETLVFGPVLVSKDSVSRVARFGRSKRVDATSLVDVRGDHTEIFFIGLDSEGNEEVAITVPITLPNAVILPSVYEQLRQLGRDRRVSVRKFDRKLPLGALEAWEDFIDGHPDLVADNEPPESAIPVATTIIIDDARTESELGPAGPGHELAVADHPEAIMGMVNNTSVAEFAATVAAKVAAAVATEFVTNVSRNESRPAPTTNARNESMRANDDRQTADDRAYNIAVASLAANLEKLPTAQPQAQSPGNARPSAPMSAPKAPIEAVPRSAPRLISAAEAELRDKLRAVQPSSTPAAPLTAAMAPRPVQPPHGPVQPPPGPVQPPPGPVQPPPGPAAPPANIDQLPPLIRREPNRPLAARPAAMNPAPTVASRDPFTPNRPVLPAPPRTSSSTAPAPESTAPNPLTARVQSALEPTAGIGSEDQSQPDPVCHSFRLLAHDPLSQDANR